MANFALTTTKTDSPKRTAAGQKWSTFPVLSGATESKHLLPGCSGCTKEATHGPCSLIGVQPRYTRARAYGITAAQHLTCDDARALFSALWLLEFCHYGYIGDNVLYNAGEGADNAAQAYTWEITAASGSTLTLYGANPKRIVAGQSRRNPEWPLPDPETGSTARFISESQSFAMREGAEVEFLHPSVLATKIRPYIKKINPPASNSQNGVTFTVELSHSCNNAMAPYDAAYPPADGKYYCKVRWYEFYPEDWPNCQEDIETQFSTASDTWTRAEAVTASGLLELLDTQGGSCRVLLPDMTPLELNAMAVVIAYDNAAAVALTEAEMLAIIDTTQVGAGQWTTTLDVNAYLTADTGNHITTFSVAYRPEAAHASDPAMIQFAGSCSNDQSTASESYGGARRCMAAATADLAADYEPGQCWQPSCSGFCLGTGRSGETYQSGNVAREWQDWRRSDLLTAAWVACSWILVQGMPGISSYRNFHYARPGTSMGSIAQLFGSGMGDNVPAGMFSTQVALHLPVMGTRTTGSDGSGATQTITKGGFTLQDTWTAGGTPTNGWISTNVSAWTTQTDACNNSLAAPLAQLPGRVGHCHLYDFETAGNGYPTSNQLQTSSEAHITNIGLGDAEDVTLAATIRARFA